MIGSTKRKNRRDVGSRTHSHKNNGSIQREQEITKKNVLYPRQQNIRISENNYHSS